MQYVDQRRDNHRDKNLVGLQVGSNVNASVQMISASFSHQTKIYAFEH
jgi:hypothetical protein